MKDDVTRLARPPLPLYRGTCSGCHVVVSARSLFALHQAEQEHFEYHVRQQGMTPLPDASAVPT